MAQKITVKVVKKEQVTEKTYFVTFRLVSPPEMEFRAGQNMMLMITPAAAGKPGVNRTMSIASPPSSRNELLMVHDVSPMGPGSQWTVELKVGDTAVIVAPTGGALSFIDSPRRKVLVATGTGIAPFHAMILDSIEDGKTVSLRLYWGLRYREDGYWVEEFDRIAREHVNFSWDITLSRPPEDWTGLRGHVTEHLFTEEKDMPESEFYLCGNKTMIEDVRAKLLEHDVPKEQIKTELFY